MASLRVVSKLFMLQGLALKALQIIIQSSRNYMKMKRLSCIGVCVQQQIENYNGIIFIQMLLFVISVFRYRYAYLHSIVHLRKYNCIFFLKATHSL